MAVWERLISAKKRFGAGYLVLIDPDKLDRSRLMRLAERCGEEGVDALLVGTSFLMNELLDEVVKAIKSVCDLPVILFPGSSHHLSKHADAILFLSLISGRNPELLIGEHVKAAPFIKRFGIEAIPTGYMLIESGSYTSVEFMSGTRPLPRDKYDIACAHAIAAELLGMRCVYLEAGSGAKLPVPSEMISAVRSQVEIPIIVGGGIRSPEVAREKVEAGADFIVTGNVLEKDPKLLSEFVSAVHLRRP